MAERHATALVWLRRDLRVRDNVALDRAAHESARVVCAFVLDPVLLRGPEIGAPIVSFFFDALAELRETLRARGSDLALLEGDFTRELRALAKRVGADALYYNVDYVPSALERDRAVGDAFRADGAHVEACLDHVYFGATEIGKPTGEPCTVYTPYKRRWLEAYERDARAPVDSSRAVAKKLASASDIGATHDVPEPARYGHARSERFPRGGETIARKTLDAFVEKRIGAYADDRDLPARPGTSYLSPHLRAGTIGIRECIATALAAREGTRGAARTGIDTWVGELIWRDFYNQILANFPHVATQPFDPRAKKLHYRDATADGKSDWEAWCEGRTGYPIVDAAMRQLNATGWMHNRLRMIVASFLTKDLLLDYRLGERYFEQHLADGDTAANNGGWQWSASTGTDAAPYFRVFNPILQSKKFDPTGAFIKEMVPELASLGGEALHAPWTLSPLEARGFGVTLGETYPSPIVDHASARIRALETYAPVFGKGSAPAAGVKS